MSGPRTHLPVLTGAAGLLAVGGSIRFIQAVWAAPDVAPWLDEQIPPLLDRLAGRPIEQIDQRQYGVVMFLILDPAARLLGDDPSALRRYALGISIGALVLAYAGLARWVSTRLWPKFALAAMWFASLPAIYAIANRTVESWLLLFFVTAFLLWTDTRTRAWAAIPLAAATLTKLYPGFLLGYVMLQDRRALAIGLAAVGSLLAIGNIVYAPLVGFGYPAALLSVSASAVDQWSVHPENESLRGLVFKLAAGFRYSGDHVAVSAEAFPTARLIAYGVSLTVVSLFALVVWRGRRDTSAERFGGEFALAIVVMLLVSPHTAFEYLVLTLLAFAFLFRSWLHGRARVWPRWWTAAIGISLVLIGVFMPLSALAAILPIDWLIRFTGNEGVPFLGPHFGGYTYFCIPLLGLLALWLVLMATVSATTERPA